MSNPILFEHNDSEPIGYWSEEGGMFVMHFSPDSKIPAESLGRLYSVAPTYKVLEVDDNGYVTKAELISLSVLGSRR